MRALRQHFRCLIIILFPSQTFCLRDICLDKKLLSQESGENMYQFVCRLRQQAVTCEFGIKCCSSHLRQKFLEKEGTIAFDDCYGLWDPKKQEINNWGLVHATGVHGSFGSYELIKTQITSIFGKKLKFINSFPLKIFFLAVRPK